MGNSKNFWYRVEMTGRQAHTLTMSLLMIWNLSKFFGLWVQFYSRISTWRLSDKLTNIWMTSFGPVWLRYIDTYGTILRSDESILNMKSFRNEHHHHHNQYELDKIVCGMRHKSLDEFRRSNHPNQFRALRLVRNQRTTPSQTMGICRFSTLTHTDTNVRIVKMIHCIPYGFLLQQKHFNNKYDDTQWNCYSFTCWNCNDDDDDDCATMRFNRRLEI